MQTGSLDRAMAMIADNRPPAVRRSGRFLRMRLCAALVICDLAAIALCHFVMQLAAGAAPLSDSSNLLLIGALAYLILAAYGRAYDSEAVRFVSKSFNRSLTAIVIAALTTLLAGQLVVVQWTGMWDALVFLPIFVALIMAFRYLFDRMVGRKFRPLLFNKVMIVDGLEVETPEGFRLIDAGARGLKPDAHDPLMRHWAASYIEHADRVIIACPPDGYAAWARFLKGSNVNIEILMPELEQLGVHSASSKGALTTVGISGGYLDSRNRLMKRALDLAVAALLILLFTPVMVICAAMIKREDGGPIFFRQLRVGRGNRLFTVYKFRSMKPDLCDSGGFAVSPPRERHFTKTGRFIRRTSIDELPQLFNVLKGDMSLVGPRPHAPGSRAGDQPFWEIEERYWHRHAIKPGITGLAQIRGYRGATKRRADLSNRLHSDLEYLRGWSIWRDIAILASTIFVLVHKNAH